MAKADTTPRNASNLTGFQRDLLLAVAAIGPERGLAVKEEAEAQRDEEINNGRLYPNLDTLVAHGLVEKGEIDRRTNSYELTERGQQVIDGQRERYEEVSA
ncbi:helix-turn-helix transcriptional regulator [Halomontanus rarus]|uniref:helix-turn-helix transcriptional regulator n=1 Tax=Halomontanus rarus TaxID=3034020 RepID=UPI00307BC956